MSGNVGKSQPVALVVSLIFGAPTGSQHQLGHAGSDADEPEPRLLLAPALELEHAVGVRCAQWCTVVLTLAGRCFEWGACHGKVVDAPRR
jgi:hypothetical protein